MGDVYYSEKQYVKNRKVFVGDSWTAKTYGKDLSIWTYKSHVDLFDYSEMYLGKKYIDSKLFLSTIIFSKGKRCLLTLKKEHISDLLELLSLCDFKLELVFLYIKNFLCKYSLDKNRKTAMLNINKIGGCEKSIFLNLPLDNERRAA